MVGKGYGHIQTTSYFSYNISLQKNINNRIESVDLYGLGLGGLSLYYKHMKFCYRKVIWKFVLVGGAGCAITT